MCRSIAMAIGGVVLVAGVGLSDALWAGEQRPMVLAQIPYEAPPKQLDVPDVSDRKSTRLNSSHT